MRAVRVLPARHIVLAAPDDFVGWRNHARELLAADVSPDEVVWAIAGYESQDLFAAETAPLFQNDEYKIRISRDLLDLLRTALMHRDPSRFARAYQLLWRLRSDATIARDPADPDMIALRGLAKAVRRDIHKMHAFVRFRRVGESHDREQFAAWFQPDHHIVRATAGFFRDRFAGMDWIVVTPDASISWDGSRLRAGPGGKRQDVPEDDAIEAEWRAYYTSIFNPARLKVDAMKREMPVRYWQNLPEADLIPGLVRNAGARVSAMVDVRPEQGSSDMFGADPNQPQRAFDSLEAFNRALREEDAALSPGFSAHIVLGEGSVGAPIMFVGEQPGDQEDLLDRPFVGPAGQLLDKCLAEAGIDRPGAYLTNAVKRFKFQPRGKRRLHQTPTAGDIAHYRWWLAEEVRLVKPKLVVSLGATALHALTGRKQPLAPVRGTAIPSGEFVLLPTVHPSFLLRLPDAQARDIEREKFIRDLRKAAQLASA